MIEYIHNAIRATAGDDTPIAAIIRDEVGAIITENCHLQFLDGKKQLIANIDGAFDGDQWQFVIPSALTEGLKGRHYYCIVCDDVILNFRESLYLI